MPERKISKADVERIVFGPNARAPYVGKGGATREFYGSLSDGRSFYVVTNSEITRAITVVDYEDESIMNTLQAAFRVTFEQVPNSIAVAYVMYRERPEDSPPPRTKRISQDVNVDFDQAGAVLGIELIGVDAESIATARQFAESHGLAFPRDIAGNLAAA